MPLLSNASFKEFGSLVCLWQDVKLQRKTQLEVGSLNATWSRDLWGHRVIVFFGNVSNRWLNSYDKFGGATRRPFFAICEKLYGGGGWNQPPPAGARVNRYVPTCLKYCSKWSCIGKFKFDYERGRRPSEFLLRKRENPEYERPAVVTLLRGLYLWNRKPDWQAVFFVG